MPLRRKGRISRNFRSGTAKPAYTVRLRRGSLILARTGCRGGGTGRRAGFKIRFPKGSGGSIPPPGTMPQLKSTYELLFQTAATRLPDDPDGDNRERWVCDACGTVHYQNPLVVVGCVPESDGKILLCKRAIEPRYGYWTVPAGFMELGEIDGRRRCPGNAGGGLCRSRDRPPVRVVDVVDAGQVHLFYTAKLSGDFQPGAESLEVALFSEDEIPWDDIAFHSGRYALKKYFEDQGENNGVHIHELRRSKS